MTQESQITYRSFQTNDFEATAELFRRQWCGEISPEAGVIASQADICSYLAEADWSLVAEKNGELAGVALLSHANRPAPDGKAWAERREALLAEAAQDPALLAQVRLDTDFLEEEAAFAAEYAAAGGLGANAELKLLIVGPAAKGAGVGGSLFSAARAEALESAGGFFLITDDSCDVSFYEHKGLTQTAARATAQDNLACETGEGDFMLYVYAEGRE